MIDEKLTLEGLFSIVLFTELNMDEPIDQGRYGFMTQTDGVTTAKSPAGMFEEQRIPNNLQYVANHVHDYYYGEPDEAEED